MSAAAHLRRSSASDDDEELVIEPVTDAELEAELGPQEAGQLRALIAESRASYARGESVPAEDLLGDIDRILAER